MPNAAAIGAKIGPKIKFVAPTSKNIPQMSSKMIINNKNVYLLLATVINAFVTATGICLLYTSCYYAISKNKHPYTGRYLFPAGWRTCGTD